MDEADDMIVKTRPLLERITPSVMSRINGLSITQMIFFACRY